MGILLVVIIWAVVLSKTFDYSNDSKELRKSWRKTQNRNNMYGK